MTVLFAGSAPDELGGAAQEDTSTTHRDPDFVPVGSKFEGMFVNMGVGFNVVTPGVSGEYWYHARFRTHSVMNPGNSRVDGHMIEFFDQNGAFICSIDFLNGEMRLLDELGNTAPVTFLTPDTEYTLDISLDLSGGTYTFKYFLGGTLQQSLSWSSSLTFPKTAIFDFFDSFNLSGITSTWYCSEVIVTQDESTIGWRLASITPAADGFHTDWQGDFTGVETLGDGKGISSGTVGDKQSWTFATLPAGVSGSAAVRGVFQNMFASTGLAGPPQIAPFTRVSGTDYDETAFTPSGIDIVEFAGNPATSAPWTAAELANLEVGVKASS